MTALVFFCLSQGALCLERVINSRRRSESVPHQRDSEGEKERLLRACYHRSGKWASSRSRSDV